MQNLDLSNFMTSKQIEEVKAAIVNGTNIIISGRINAGKSQLCKLLSKVAADSEYEYCIIDEVACERDMDYVNGLLLRGSNGPTRMIFTSHMADTDIIKKRFTNFSGLVISILSIEDRTAEITKV